VVSGLLRRELQYEGVILSDDLEMKAISATYTGPEAAVQAIAAGCDGILVCHAGAAGQVEVLEALIHAVEEDRLPRSRVDDALRRQQRAKERFLAAPVHVRPPNTKALRDALGRDEHRAIAGEMARFV
jgi:beta-N-acetylhexosaminidase